MQAYTLRESKPGTDTYTHTCVTARTEKRRHIVVGTGWLFICRRLKQSDPNWSVDNWIAEVVWRTRDGQIHGWCFCLLRKYAQSSEILKFEATCLLYG